MPRSLSWLPIRWSNSCLSRQGFCHHWGVKCQSRFPLSFFFLFFQRGLTLHRACRYLGCSLQIKLHYQSGLRVVMVRDHILPPLPHHHLLYTTAHTRWAVCHLTAPHPPPNLQNGLPHHENQAYKFKSNSSRKRQKPAHKEKLHINFELN